MTQTISDLLKQLERDRKIRAFIYTPGAASADVMHNDGQVQTFIAVDVDEALNALEGFIDVTPYRDESVGPLPDATHAAYVYAEENEVALEEVIGTGADGKITKGDVEMFVTERDA